MDSFINKDMISKVDQFANKDWQGVISEEKEKGKTCFADKDLSSWTGLGRSGLVRSQSFGSISHASGPKTAFLSNFIMVLHGFAWRR